ncbi:CocE/NonD family hydrolase [soil metagenome]
MGAVVSDMVSLQSWFSRALGAGWRLPAAQTGVDVSRAIGIEMRDGVRLSTDLYRPRGTARAPTVLMRSPYGRGHVFGLVARLFAERGYAVVLQSVRGTFGSQGRFDPFFQERDDGLDAVDWIERQPWFDGKLALFGTSYLGQVVWAVAGELGERVSAITVVQSASDFHAAIYGGRAFRLQDFLQWTQLMVLQERGHPLLRLLAKRRDARRLQRHHEELPLRTLDQRAIGEPVAFWRSWIDHGVDDPLWQAIDDHARLDRVTAPVNLVGGWSDVFLDTQERDWRRLAALGKTVRWTVGPWTHADFSSQGEGMRQSLDWFDQHLRGRPPSAAAPVRLWINGANEWRDFADSALPAGALSLDLDADGALRPEATIRGTRTFFYRPDDPTPSVSGPTLATRTGRSDMKSFSSRADVLTFGSAPLAKALELLGRARVTLTISADRPDHDVYVCLCDTDSTGRSINMTDGYLRLTERDGPPQRRRVEIECLPTAWRVAAGHRLMLMIAAGAFPRFDRHPASGGAIEITVHCAPGASALAL